MSASKATLREKPVSPVAQPQPQQHSYRSNSEVVAKKNRKQGTAGVITSKNKKREPQAQHKITELAKKLRNNDSGQADERDGHNLNTGNRYCSNSPRGSIDSKRERQNNKKSRDKTSDDMNLITPKKNNQGEHAADEKVEDSASKHQLRRHHVDPDAKNGGRELLVISITVKNRIIEATVRQNTDLSKLYDRISLLGDFGSYPHKFKDIFFRYWKSLIDDAEKLLKEEEQREQARKGSSKKSEDRSIQILSSAGKVDPNNRLEKSKPMIQVSTLSDSDKMQGASKSLEENQITTGLRRHSQSPMQASPSQHASLAQQLQSMPHLVQGINSNLGMLNGSNLEAFLTQSLKKGGYSQPTRETMVNPTAGTGSPVNDQLLQLMLQQQQQQNNLFNSANANNLVAQQPNAGGHQLQFGALPQFQTLSPHQQPQAFQQNQAGAGMGHQQNQYAQQQQIYSGRQPHGLHGQQPNSLSGAGDLSSQQHGQQPQDEGRKQSTGSNNPLVDEQQDPKQGQSSGMVPSKDEQVVTKPGGGHKTKKIKNSKVVEYTGSAKKGAQDSHSIQDYPQNMGYQQQNANIQVLSQSPLADQARVQNTKQSDRDEQTSQLGHGGGDSGKQMYQQQETTSTASQVQPQKKKKQKAPSQRKKDEYSMVMSAVDTHSIINHEQAAVATSKQGTEVMLSETGKVDDSLNKSIIQTDPNVSSFLKVGVDQESIKTVTSGAGSDIQQQLAHQMQPLQYISDAQQQQHLILLNQMQPGAPNGANFITSPSHAAGNGAPNLFVGQGLLNNGLPQVTAANQNGNAQLMNFTFNNFNNHSLGGIQPQSNQQLLANQLNVAATGQQMLGLNLNAQDLGQGVGAPHPGYGNAGNFVSHINTIGAIGVNINNFNNFQFNNGQLNSLAIAGQNPQQFINDVTGSQYQAGLNQQLTNQGTYPHQLPQPQSQQNGTNFIIGAQSQQQQDVQQSPSQQPHANTSPTQQSMIQQMLPANQVKPHNSQQQPNHFLQQPQMNNGGNFFQSMPGPSSQQPMMLSSGQTGGALGGSQSATSGATLPMSSSQQQPQSILSPQQTQPQSVTSLGAGPNPPIMHQHHPGTSQIQGAIQNQQPYQQVQHLQQPGPSQVVSQAASNSEGGARPQGGGGPQGSQKGGVAVGQKMSNQMAINQQQNQLNPNLNLNLGSNGGAPLYNTLPSHSLSSQHALQLLGSPYQHLSQAQIALAPGASGGHGAGNGSQGSQQLTQGPGGLQQMQKVVPMQANYMGGPPPPLPQPHLVGHLINQPGPNTNNQHNIILKKPPSGISSGNGQQMTTAPANASARGAASAASVTLPNTGGQQTAQAQAQQTHMGIIGGTAMHTDGSQAPVKQGAVAAAVHINNSSNSQQNQAMAQAYSNRGDLNSSNLYQQKRTGEGFPSQLQGSGHQSQVINSNQPAGGGLGASTQHKLSQQSAMGGSTNSSQQHNRRGNNNSSTTGARGGDQPQSQFGTSNHHREQQRTGNNSTGNNNHQQQHLNSHKNSKGRQNQRLQK